MEREYSIGSSPISDVVGSKESSSITVHKILNQSIPVAVIFGFRIRSEKAACDFISNSSS